MRREPGVSRPGPARLPYPDVATKEVAVDMANALTREHVAGLRPAELQAYEQPFFEVGVPPLDVEDRVPHRRLTSSEAAHLQVALWQVEEHFGREYEEVYRILDELRARTEAHGPLNEEWRTAIDAAANLHWNFARAFGVLAFLAGQREGFRLGVAAVTRGAQDPTVATAVMGALADDRQLDRLIGQLATGREDPEYIL